MTLISCADTADLHLCFRLYMHVVGFLMHRLRSVFYAFYFQVLIEFDDIDWTRREWIRVHDIFQLFLVEHTLVWAERPDPDKPKHSVSWPGLVSTTSL